MSALDGNRARTRQGTRPGRWTAVGVGLVALATSGTTCFSRSNADNPETLRHQVACVEYPKKQDLEPAESRCKLCLEYDKNNPECLNNMGMIWYLRGNNDQARDWYKRAMKARNDFPEARSNMGVVVLEQDHDFKGAEKLFLSAIKIDPGYVDARGNLAWTYSLMGDVEMAEAQETIRAKKLNDRDPKVVLKYYKDAEERHVQADDQLRRIFELDPKNFKAYSIMAFIEMKRAQYAPTEKVRLERLGRAQDMGLRCVELAPMHVPEARSCRGNLAAAQFKLGQCDQSLVQWMSCLAIAPKDIECQRGMAEAYTCVSTRTGAIKKYLEQVQGNPGYAPGHFNLCIAAFEANLPDMAAASCENALQLDNKLCLAHYHLGKHYRNILNQEKAIGYCRSFISCTGTQNPVEIQECKDLIQALEVQN